MVRTDAGLRWPDAGLGDLGELRVPSSGGSGLPPTLLGGNLPGNRAELLIINGLMGAKAGRSGGRNGKKAGRKPNFLNSELVNQ
jgi:hypothetical protein